MVPVRRLRSILLGIALCPVALTLGGTSGCRETVIDTRPQLMVALETDAIVPDDLTGFSYELLQNGNLVQSEPTRSLFDGSSGDKLPGTLAFVVGEQSPGSLVTLRVWATRNDRRLALREVQVRLPTEAQGARLLTMPLQRACIVAAECDQTSATCVPPACYDGDSLAQGAEIATDALPVYAPGQLFGGGNDRGEGGSCFGARACFEGARSARVDPVVEQRSGREVCVVTDASLGVAVDPSIVNFAVQRTFPASPVRTRPEELCGPSPDGSVVRCYPPLSARPAGISDEQAPLLAPFTYVREATGWVLPRAICSLPGDDTLVVSASCPQKTPDVPRCGWTFVSGAVVDPTSRPTGFAGFPPRTYCDVTGDRCDDPADCLGKRCLPKPSGDGACFLDRHCAAGKCAGATICPQKTSCETVDAPGTCQTEAKSCFVDAQCDAAAGEFCAREPGCAQAGQSGLCTTRPTSCDGVPVEAVCGCDLVSYPSTCAAAQAGVDAASKGNCAPCLGRSDGSYCATTLGFPAARAVVVCSGSSVVSTEPCAQSCETQGAGKAACN